MFAYTLSPAGRPWCSGAMAARRQAEHLIDRITSNIAHGRFERSLSGLVGEYYHERLWPRAPWTDGGSA